MRSTVPPCFTVHRGVKRSERDATKQGCSHFCPPPRRTLPCPELLPIFVQHSSLCVGDSSQKGSHEDEQVKWQWA